MQTTKNLTVSCVMWLEILEQMEHAEVRRLISRRCQGSSWWSRSMKSVLWMQLSTSSSCTRFRSSLVDNQALFSIFGRHQSGETQITMVWSRSTKRFMHHYNFHNTLLVKLDVTVPGRRELVTVPRWACIAQVLPSLEEFHTLSIISSRSPLESNGSSSSSFICAGTLGPYGWWVCQSCAPVAGITWGSSQDGKQLHRIDRYPRFEDHFGDMDLRLQVPSWRDYTLQMISRLGESLQKSWRALPKPSKARFWDPDAIEATIPEVRPELAPNCNENWYYQDWCGTRLHCYR